MDAKGKDIIDKLFFKNNDSTVVFCVWDANKQMMLRKRANTTFMKPVYPYGWCISVDVPFIDESECVREVMISTPLASKNHEGFKG